LFNGHTSAPPPSKAQPVARLGTGIISPPQKTYIKPCFRRSTMNISGTLVKKYHVRNTVSFLYTREQTARIAWEGETERGGEEWDDSWKNVCKNLV
jgi:hypothetical protein